MLLCNVCRNLLSVAAVPISLELALSPTQLGVLSSAYLWGYGAGQLPAGLLADTLGGPLVLVLGLVLWSGATAALPLAQLAPSPLTALVVLRALFGLASAVALPATSASVAQLVPPERRASSLSLIYGLFNVGSTLGLLTAPLLMAGRGWAFPFHVYGVLGLLFAALALALLPRRRAQPLSAAAAAPVLRPGGLLQLAVLVYVHSVIGWGYFLLLSWIPTYLRTQLGLTSLSTLGLLSSLPWLVCAAVGILSGAAADALARRGWPRLAVRTAAHRIATLLPAAAIACLPFAGGLAPAVVCLSMAMGAQALNYAGFHAHANAAGGARAGLLLAATNSVGIAAGIAANVATGALLERTGRFDIVFAVTAALYASSLLVWVAVVREGPIFE